MKRDTTPASDLERRKHVRLRLRTDLSIAPQKYEGRTYYVVKDPVSLRYYRFKEQEQFLIQLMDGTHTLDDAQKAFENRFRPDRLTLEDLESFGQQLITAGLAQNESPAAGKQLWDRRKKRLRSEWIQTFTNILYIKIPVFDPDKLLVKMLRYTRWIFTTWFLLASIAVFLGAILLVATHFHTFLDRLPSYHEFFSFKTVIYLWAALGIVKVIHEFGHGLSCKAFGGEVHEMGFLFLCFSPCLYCNVSDAWTLPNKWKRIIISGAGIYVELIIAALCTFIWWNTPTNPFVNYMSLCLMIVCSVSTVMFNANPLMRFDGYYVLADWLEIPNLRDRSNKYLQRVLMDFCLGMEVQPEPYMEMDRRILFISYAVVSYVYRWVITFSILFFMSNFLGPKLKVISQMLAVAAAASMVGWPIYRLGKAYHKRGRVPDMKPVRVTITASVLAAFLLGFFFVPLPVSRVRETGVVETRPGAVTPVYVEVPGILLEIKVKEGQHVEKGTILAIFRDHTLEEKSGNQMVKWFALIQKVEALASFPKSPVLLQEKGKAEGERDNARKMWEFFEEQKKRVVLRAPRAGTVFGVPRVEDIGKQWSPGSGGYKPNAGVGAQGEESGRSWEQLEDHPFCQVGDPNKLRVLVPVSPDNYDLIRTDLHYFHQHNRDLEVTIRIEGRGSQTWKGIVTHLPESPAKEIPVPLGNKAGGPLAIKVTSSPEHPEPQAQIYLVGVDILDADTAIAPGVLAQVKIHCKYRSSAWWIWRWISSLLDLPLSV